MRDGSEYRGKKASGDMKKKNQKHQPYAYLPLNPAILNKRKAKKVCFNIYIIKYFPEDLTEMTRLFSNLK